MKKNTKILFVSLFFCLKMVQTPIFAQGFVRIGEHLKKGFLVEMAARDTVFIEISEGGCEPSNFHTYHIYTSKNQFFIARGELDFFTRNEIQPYWIQPISRKKLRKLEQSIWNMRFLNSTDFYSTSWQKLKMHTKKKSLFSYEMDFFNNFNYSYIEKFKHFFNKDYKKTHIKRTFQTALNQIFAKKDAEDHEKRLALATEIQNKVVGNWFVAQSLVDTTEFVFSKNVPNSGRFFEVAIGENGSFFCKNEQKLSVFKQITCSALILVDNYDQEIRIRPNYRIEQKDSEIDFNAIYFDLISLEKNEFRLKKVQY
jgi:hypothetical protein